LEIMDKPANRPATIKDVARDAGVSFQTVSRVINQHPSVKPKTRKKVLEVIEALQYQPNTLAQRLVTKRSNALGMISFGTSQFGPSQMSENIEQVARQRGYSINLVHLADTSVQEMTRAIAHLRSQQIDGLVMLAPLVNVQLGELQNLCQDLPTVLLETHEKLDLGGFAMTIFDQYQGAKMAAEHLLAQGRRKIVLLCGPNDWSATTQRLKGWQAALFAEKLEPVAILEGDWSAKSGYLQTTHLLEQGAEFDAILAANDQMALGVLLALQQTGHRVPEDMSVVGFDNIPESEFFYPPLTTVAQDFSLLGQRAIEQLVGLIEMPNLVNQIQVIATRFVLRQSA
jgi:DNA-binding LacI/PurR family transcriptional regulator